MKRTSIIIAASISVLGGASQALAGTASTIGSQAGFRSAAGETNHLKISQAGNAIVFTDTGAPVTAGAGCTAINANSASCAIPPSLNLVFATLGDGNDDAVVDNTVNFGPPDPSVQLDGEAGNDVLTGGEATNDSLTGGDGNDTLAGRGGTNGFSGGAGADIETGGPGVDLYYGQDDGNDTINAGAGGDTVTLTATPDGADTISLGPGRDRMDWRQRRMPLVLTMDGAADDGAAGEGDNLAADVEDVEGGASADRIVGTQSGAPTRIQGDGGNDTITGGPGPDAIDGSAGNDTINAGAGNDQIEGGFGADTVDAGAGDDLIAGHFDDASPDVLRGGPGTDQVSYEESRNPIAVSLDDVANDGASDERDNVATDVEDVVGTAFDDTISGSDGPNQFDGREGNDTLSGRGGSDGLVGGRGSDTLSGGAGIDTLDGGDGADRIASRDASADDVACGGSVDTVIADRLDALRGCEALSIGVGFATARVRPASGRVKVALTCPAVEGAPCRGTLRLTRRVTLGTARFVIPAGSAKVVTVKLTRAGRAARGTATATATMTDSTGASATTSRKLTIRR